jgi:hypothetical protein
MLAALFGTPLAQTGVEGDVSNNEYEKRLSFIPVTERNGDNFITLEEFNNNNQKKQTFIMVSDYFRAKQCLEEDGQTVSMSLEEYVTNRNYRGNLNAMYYECERKRMNAAGAPARASAGFAGASNDQQSKRDGSIAFIGYVEKNNKTIEDYKKFKEAADNKISNEQTELKNSLEYGKQIIFEWISITRDFMAMVATNSHTSLRALDIKYDVETSDNTFFEELANLPYFIKDDDLINNKGNEAWRYETISRRFQISLRPDFVRLQMQLQAKYGNHITERCFTTIKSTLTHPQESTLFARYVGSHYTETHQPKYVKLNTMVQGERDLETFFAICRYVERI